MPNEIDLIEALRQFERMSGSTNPYSNPYERQSMAQPMGGMDNIPFKADRIGPVGMANSQGDFSDELMQQYMAHLDKIPQRNKPGLVQKIFGGLASVNDPRAGEDILYGSYNRALDDWKTQADAIYKGSSQERLYNVNRRQQEALESQDKYRQGQLDVANRRVANAEARTAIALEKQRNPNGKIMVTEDGSLVLINPQSGEPTFVLKEDGSPVKSNELSDEQVINMRIAGDLQKIDASSDAAMKLEAARNANRLGQIHAGGVEARATKQVVPGGAAAGLTRPETPAARNQRIRNNANEFRAQFPRLAKHITIDGTNVSITDPNTSGGPTQEEYDQMYESIFNAPEVKTDIELKPESGSITTSPTPEVSAAPVLPKTGTKRKELAPDVLKRAMAGVEPGKVLVTNGTEYGQMTLENARKLKEPGWYVVGSKE